MANRRVKTLAGTGAVTANARFADYFYMPLTGNVTLTINGHIGRSQLIIYAMQDATGGRTVTIPAASGGANINIGTATGVATTANATTKIIIQRINGRNNIVWMGGA